MIQTDSSPRSRRNFGEGGFGIQKKLFTHRERTSPATAHSRYRDYHSNRCDRLESEKRCINGKDTDKSGKYGEIPAMSLFSRPIYLPFFAFPATKEGLVILVPQKYHGSSTTSDEHEDLLLGGGGGRERESWKGGGGEESRGNRSGGSRGGA